MTSCGPDREQCDYSYTCPNHQAEIERERVAQQERDERDEMMRLLKSIQSSMLVIAQYLKPIAEEQRAAAIKKAISGP